MSFPVSSVRSLECGENRRLCSKKVLTWWNIQPLGMFWKDLMSEVFQLCLVFSCQGNCQSFPASWAEPKILPESNQGTQSYPPLPLAVFESSHPKEETVNFASLVVT